jgi:signal transduction histidine kinase
LPSDQVSESRIGMTEFCFAPGLSLADVADAVEMLAPDLAADRPILAAGAPLASGSLKILFASPSMLRLFGSADLEELFEQLFIAGGEGSVRLAALADHLPFDGTWHREKLHYGSGSSVRTLNFSCRRFSRRGMPPLFLAVVRESDKKFRVRALFQIFSDRAAPDGLTAARASPQNSALAQNQAAPPSEKIRPTPEAPGPPSAPVPPADARNGHDASLPWTGSDEEIFRAIGRSLGATAGGAVAPPLVVPSPEAEHGPDLPLDAGPSQDILDHLPIGIVIFRESVPIFANPALLSLLGYADVSHAFLAGGFEAIVRGLRDLTESAKTIYLRAEDSKPVPVEVTARSVRWGLQPALLVTVQPQKNSGRERSADWPRWQAELDAARREAERVSAQKSQFLAKVSHEIRTPLNAILGFAEVMLEERFGPLGNERYRSYLKDIHASGTLVMSLVNDILDLSKIEAGKADLAFAAVDANRIITECVSIMEPQAAREGIALQLDLSPDLPLVLADERSLRQIALNLLSNAVKFNEPGGEVIVATAINEAGHVVLRIKDTGVGMSEDEIEVAMEPFRQLETARTRSGTGLGLPLTKALVEANRAFFSIKSKKHEGTLVEVAFPPGRAVAE